MFAMFVSTPVLAMLCSTDANVAIADGAGSATPGAVATATIVVPAAFEGTVLDMNFDLVINHTYVGDLIVTLTSPDGTIVTLMDRPGSPATTFGCSNDNVDATFDDASGVPVETQCAAPPAIAGTLNPTGTMADFNGDTIAGTWTVSVTDNAGQDTGTLISTGSCIDFTTTPVTISSFMSKKRGASLIAKWQTSSEVFNLGFNLWGDVDGNWTQLNRRLIPSREVDSSAPLRYRAKIGLNKLDGDLSSIGVSSVSVSGDEEFYGPFELGEKYGEDSVPKYIDWSSERANFDHSMQQRGFVKIKNRWRKNTNRLQQRDERLQRRFPDSIIEIKEAGIYRLSYADLLSQGVDLRRMPVSQLAITRNGQAVARLIDKDSGAKRTRKNRRFSENSSIVFYAEGPSQEASRYVQNATYRIEVDPSKVLLAHSSNFKPSVDGEADDIGSHRKHIQLGSKKLYSTAMSGDGWFDASIRAIGANASKEYSFEIPSSASLNEPAIAQFSLLGIANFPRVDADGDGELEPNHHYRVYVNRGINPDPVAEGYKNGREQFDVEFDASLYLSVGTNVIEIEIIPDNGYNLDLAYVVDGSISYMANNILAVGELQNGRLAIQVNDAVSVISLEVTENIADVIAVDDKLNLARLSFTQTDNMVRIKPPFNASSRGELTVHVLSESAYLSPELIREAESARPAELNLEGVDYVVIADESLVGEDLQRFSDRQTELGRNTKVVSSKAIYDSFSDGLALPEAIAEYLLQQSLVSDYAYVLLVGGHTYNYRSYNLEPDKELVNLLPSFYRGTFQAITGGLTQQIPTAVPFVDFDKDGAPDRAIGRWPVRNLDQVKLMVDKTLEWHADDSHRSDRTALFIADANEPKNNFIRSSNRVMSSIANDSAPWSQIDTVYQDDVAENDAIPASEKLAYVRKKIIEKMNQGPALTVYSGHASVGVWGRQSLVYNEVANKFTNSGSPSIVLPLACYTTYYETPDVKSLAEQMLTDNPAGAVVLAGAALLSVSGDNERFGRRLLEKMTVDGLDIGTATLQTKQELLASSPGAQTVVYNWVTLGDPSLSFGLPSIRPVHTEERPGKQQ